LGRVWGNPEKKNRYNGCTIEGGRPVRDWRKGGMKRRFLRRFGEGQKVGGGGEKKNWKTALVNRGRERENEIDGGKGREGAKKIEDQGLEGKF